MKRVSILLLLTIFFASCSGEEPLQNPQTGENVENLVEDVENPKVKVAVRIGFHDNFWIRHDQLRSHINLLYNIVTYNSIAIKLLELPDIEFVRDDSIDGHWDYMIEFGISSVLDENAIYWIILQNADGSDGKSRTVFYPDISLGRIPYYYESESIGNKVVEQKQYASEGAENQKAKIAINIHENSAYKEGAYNSIAKNLVVLPDVEFESDSTIDGVWDYMVVFRMLFPRNDGNKNITYWTTLQNADSSNGESRTVFYPDINFEILDFAQLQNVSRDIVEQFRIKHLDAH